MENKLKNVESFANATRLMRIISMPHKYGHLIWARHFNSSRYGVMKKTKTFWGDDFSVLLPASNDIFLSGGKTHDSEIRLCKYMIKHLKEKDFVFDIGAHFGFFSLLMAKLVSKGQVHSFEASPNNFEMLKQNSAQRKNIYLNHLAISDTNEPIRFYEFPAKYSEYNSTVRKQYEDEAWFDQNKPNEVFMPALTVDEYCNNHSLVPAFIKIDVEGAEDKAMLGAKETLKNNKVVVAMEYLEPNRNNQPHQRAVEFFKSIGYATFVINQDGDLVAEQNLDDYLRLRNLESDNIVFVKQ